MGRAEAARRASETPLGVSAAAAFLFLWGLVNLALIVLVVTEGLDTAPSYPLGLWFAMWLGYGALCIATGVWLSRLDRLSVPGVVAFAILSLGKVLADFSRGAQDDGTWIRLALSALALYAIARHRELFRRA